MLAKLIPLFCFSKKEGGPLPMAMVGGTEAKLPLHFAFRISNLKSLEAKLPRHSSLLIPHSSLFTKFLHFLLKPDNNPLVASSEAFVF